LNLDALQMSMKAEEFEELKARLDEIERRLPTR
jgi:tetrahydromethanopterin S-methyltransferase subunit G